MRSIFDGILGILNVAGASNNGKGWTQRSFFVFSGKNTRFFTSFEKISKNAVTFGLLAPITSEGIFFSGLITRGIFSPPFQERRLVTRVPRGPIHHHFFSKEDFS